MLAAGGSARHPAGEPHPRGGGRDPLRRTARAKVAAGQPILIDGASGAVGKRKSASALRKASRVLAPGGRRITVDDGTPKLGCDRVYPLEDIVEAHRYVSGGHKRGNVIVTLD
ncbi:MAG: zinc-binding dehydrogenase [Kouleothrix sp.]|nr:zinc-binding dehydrogenase [Kouleothrix sp.]